MPALKYRQESLAQCIDSEVQTFIKQFGKSFSNTLPLLIFPMDLGLIITKCIRYHAAIYGLMSFYVKMGGKMFIVLCQHRDLNMCNSLDYYCHEDSEVIYPFMLYTGITASIRSLISQKHRSTFGLDIRDNTTPTADSHSSGNQFSAKFHSNRDQSEKNLENLPVTKPINCNGVGDSLLNNLTDDASSITNGLGLTLETMVPTFEFEKNLFCKENFFEFKHLMDKVLECVSDSHCPLFIQVRNDYDRFKYITDSCLNTVVELYNIPKTYKLVNVLKLYKFGPKRVKWCDDTHALVIFLRRNHADMALALYHHSIKTRPMINASPIVTVVGCMMDFPKIFAHLENQAKSSKIRY